MTAARALADPRVRFAAGTAALLGTAMAARRDRVGPDEAAAFRAVNDLPGWLYPPAWAVMQLGAHLPLDVAGGALGVVIDAALTLVKEKVEPKGPGNRDLGPWPVPAGTGQPRRQHPVT